MGALHLLQEIHQHDPLFIKGMCFSGIDYEHLIPVGLNPVSGRYGKLKKSEDGVLRQSEKLFRIQCEKSGIGYGLCDQTEYWNKSLFVKESRFADLVIISEELLGANIFLKEQPNHLMEELLHSAECPIMVVPEGFQAINNLVLAYDGSPSSVFAIKQFVSCFPRLTDRPSEFVFIKSAESDNIPDRLLLDEYASLHFHNYKISALHFEPDRYLSTWLEERKDSILIAGSYARSGLSNLLAKSFANPVIKNSVCPAFITHPV